MRKDHTQLAWLSLPVQESKDFNYREMEKVVTKLCGVNNPAKRAVKAAGDRTKSVGSKKARPPFSFWRSCATSPLT